MTNDALQPHKELTFNEKPLRIYIYGTRLLVPIRDVTDILGYGYAAAGTWAKHCDDKHITKLKVAFEYRARIQNRDWLLADRKGILDILDVKGADIKKEYEYFFNRETHALLPRPANVQTAKQWHAMAHQASIICQTFLRLVTFFKDEIQTYGPAETAPPAETLKRVKDRNISKKLEELAVLEAQSYVSLKAESPVTGLFVGLAVVLLQKVRALANQFDVELTVDQLVNYKFTIENEPAPFRPPSKEKAYKEDD